MPIDKNPQNPAGVTRPRSEDAERRLKARETEHERPEHYILRECLGHDDLERDTPDVSNLAYIQPYVTGHDPIRDHRREEVRKPWETLQRIDDDN